MELPGRRLAGTAGRRTHLTVHDPVAVPTSFQLRVDGPGQGAWNMAVDEALMGLARAGIATLRFYTWEPGCLSFGRNQSTPARVQGRLRAELLPGEAVVRRPTGGRSVYHHRELTYSVTVPDRLWGGPRRLYRRVNQALRRGLVSLGAPLDPDPFFDREPRPCAEGRDGPGPAEARDRQRALDPQRALGPQACFQAPVPGEVTSGGRKLVGSAQWRHRGVLLQHGSILLLNEQGRGGLHAVEAVAGGRVAGGRADDGRTHGGRAERAAIGLSEIVPELPEIPDLIRTLTDAFGEEFGRRPERGPLDPALHRSLVTETRRLVADKYRTPEWTWRR